VPEDTITSGERQTACWWAVIGNGKLEIGDATAMARALVKAVANYCNTIMQRREGSSVRLVDGAMVRWCDNPVVLAASASEAAIPQSSMHAWPGPTRYACRERHDTHTSTSPFAPGVTCPHVVHCWGVRSRNIVTIYVDVCQAMRQSA
jgi:hypothetical protein